MLHPGVGAGPGHRSFPPSQHLRLSLTAAVAVHKTHPSTSAVTSKGQILPASPRAGCWQAVDRREGRRVGARERLLPAAPQSSSTALAATTTPQRHLDPKCPLPEGTAAPPALCPCRDARQRELQPRPLPGGGGAKVTPPPPTSSHSLFLVVPGASPAQRGPVSCHASGTSDRGGFGGTC